MPSRAFGRNGVIGFHPCACIHQAFDQRQRWRVTQVIRTGLECQPPEANRAAPELGAEAFLDLSEQPLLLGLVARFHRS
jgi:hypothetical protein